MQIGDLIEVRSFPSVVQASEVRSIRNRGLTDRTAADDFVAAYLGSDDHAHHALKTALHSLAQSHAGGAFFLNGVFGSGKSHLLGLLALLCDGHGRGAFASNHPSLADLPARFSQRLVLHFTLDEYDPARFSLEEIFWRELLMEWERRGLPEADWPATTTVSRGEAFTLLDEFIGAQQLHGLVIFIDELSLFLSAREPRDLQRDASFLQFLGQRARRTTDNSQKPLWIFAALQKTVETIGDIEAYSLSQIKDRYTTLPLALADVTTLIERRLIVRKEAAALKSLCEHTFADLQRALPRLDFGRDEWERSFPLYPATIVLLEQVVGRFLSRTRSAVLFCTQSIDLHTDAIERIYPDALFDYLEPELESHPDLRPLSTVWRDWQNSLPDLASDATDRVALIKLMKGLLLFKIAGQAPNIVQLTNAIALDLHLPGEGNYQFSRNLLEKLRTLGSHLEIERRDGEFADRYAIDAGTRVGEMARRFIRNALPALSNEDSRISQYVVDCCHQEPLPLARLKTPQTFTVLWRNAPRAIEVQLWNKALTPSRLANRVETLQQPGISEDAFFLLVPPFSEESAYHGFLTELSSLLHEEQTRSSLLVWRPRRPVHNEIATAREATAAHLLEGDPQLLDNRRGRAVLAHLRNETAARENLLSGIGIRLLLEGAMQNLAGASIDTTELACGENWTSVLEALAEFSLPHRFERFEELAPRLRVLTPSNAEALTLEILRRPADAPFFAPSLERAARGVAEPLGIARAMQGRWRIESPRDDLVQLLREAIGNGSTLAGLEAHLAKSEWGCRPEQVHLLVAALLRSGELVALDARGQTLRPAEVGLPLRRSVHLLRPGQLLTGESWQNLRQVIRLLTGEEPGAASFAAQELANGLLTQWREEALAETELAQARLHQLQRQLHHTPSQWTKTQEAREQFEKVLQTTRQTGDIIQTLNNAASLDREGLPVTLENWQSIRRKLDERQAPLLAAYAFLTHPQLVVPPELAPVRLALLNRFENGEAILDDASLLDDCATWRTRYEQRYREWHQAQHAPDRWATIRRIAAGDERRVLHELQRLNNRSFDFGNELDAALESELEKNCPRDGSLPVGEPLCPSCRLRWNERVLLASPETLLENIEQATATLRATLAEPAVTNQLAQKREASELLAWQQEAAGAADLLPLLTEEALSELDEALRPRRQVSRSLAKLNRRLTACHTRAEFMAAFQNWLNDGDLVETDDEIVLSDGE